MKTDRLISAKLFFIFFLYCIFIPSWHASAEGSPPGSTSTLTLYFENDTFYDTDREYTHGTKISWISPDLSDYRNNPLIPAWSCPLIERVPFLNKPGYHHCVSFSLGQSIYTPEDKERSDLITNERPYAGITYLAVGFHSKNDRQMDTLELDIGIVGRHSYAQDCQQTVHRWVSAADPKGWKHQLRDEPVLNAFFERKWRVLRVKSDRGFGLDVIPHIGCGAGNALTGANAGGQIRFGWNLPNDFGTFLIRPGSDSNAPMDSNDPRFFRPPPSFWCPSLLGL
ncbi:MAG: lipid A deacylase LpxR family protein [Syntrophobacterales bacterium]|nr:MAG: lipid A deacylase LpxR family protein [Syntrophobacterales bacterium]